MNVVSSPCASETDGESLWTTIACRQGPWHGCLKKASKTYKKTRYKVLWGFFPYLPVWWQIPSASSNWIACSREGRCCCWAASLSQKWWTDFLHDSLSLHCPSFPNCHFPSSLYHFLYVFPLLLVLSAPSMLIYRGIIQLKINASVIWSWKETGYGLCCILNLLTSSQVQLGSDGGTRPTVACPQWDFRYHRTDCGCKKEVLPRGPGGWLRVVNRCCVYFIPSPPARVCSTHGTSSLWQMYIRVLW